MLMATLTILKGIIKAIPIWTSFTSKFLPISLNEIGRHTNAEYKVDLSETTDNSCIG